MCLIKQHSDEPFCNSPQVIDAEFRFPSSSASVLVPDLQQVYPVVAIPNELDVEVGYGVP